jgi:CheY-like chemotaxis protein
MKKESVPPGTPPRSPLPRGLRRELLLYVEDDDDNWDIAELRLAKTFTLLRAANDEEACKLVRTRRHEIDIILMDIELRGSVLNGVELTALLRGNALPDRELPDYAQRLPPISKPIIYVTAHDARFSTAQLLRSGADKVIPKPVDFGDLRRALSELLMARTQG